MKIYTVEDFEKGVEVFHTTNPNLKMVVIGVNIESDEIVCRWVSKSSESLKETFFSSELRKWSDKSLGITLVKRRQSNWLY